MPLMPKRVKFRKSQRGKVKGNATRGNYVAFGEYGLQALEAGKISAQTIEAGRVVGDNDFIAPLAAQKGDASKMGQGSVVGVVESEYKGHYLILTWAEFTNGSTPSGTTEDNELEKFCSDLVADTVNISLSERMVTGAPATAAPSASAS